MRVAGSPGSQTDPVLATLLPGLLWAFPTPARDFSPALPVVTGSTGPMRQWPGCGEDWVVGSPCIGSVLLWCSVWAMARGDRPLQGDSEVLVGTPEPWGIGRVAWDWVELIYPTAFPLRPPNQV